METMTRRQLILVMTASPFAIAGLAACGGSGSGSGGASGLSVTTTTGAVTLPAGFSLSPSTLQVQTGIGTSALQPDKSFRVNLVQQAEGPTLAWLRSADKVIYAGFIDSSNKVIDARSTAIALLYFGLGGYTIPAKEKAHLLSLIAADPSVTPLANVIQARVAANPTAIVDGDPQVGAALKTAVDAISAQTPTRAPKSIASLPSRAGSRADEGALLQLTPDGIHSNLEVLHGSAAQTFIATNHARRHCRVFVYEVGKEDKAGVRTDYTTAKLIPTPVALGSTRALGVLSTIFGFFKRDTAFTPVSTEPIQLTLADNSSKTFFDIIVLGSSTIAFDPGFYTEPKYAGELQAWRDARIVLNLTSWLGDIIFGLLLEIWGVHDLVKGEAAVQSAIQEFRNIEFDTWGIILGLAGTGKFVEATKEFLGFSSKSVANAVRIRAALASLLPNLGINIAADEAAAGAQVCLKMFQAAFAAAGAILGAVDIGAVLYDLANSEPGERWQGTLIKQDVRISPATTTLRPGDGTNFTASVPTIGGQTVVYKWSVAAQFAVLTDTVGGKSGKSFETSSKSIALATTPSDKNNITVTVEAISVAAGGERKSIGIATAAVTMKEDDDPPFGSVIVRLSGAPGGDLDPTLVRQLDRVRAQQIPLTAGSKLPILVESVHELIANFGPKNTQLFMTLNFGNEIKTGQTVPLTFGNNLGMTMRLAGPTTGGANVRFVATGGSLTVLSAGTSGFPATETIRFRATASMQAQDDPSLNFGVTMEGWITDITLL